MRFAEADVAYQHDVCLGCDEGQTEQVLDLRAVDLSIGVRGQAIPISLFRLKGRLPPADLRLHSATRVLQD
jgi:hypothetical protein